MWTRCTAIAPDTTHTEPLPHMKFLNTFYLNINASGVRGILK